MPHRCSAIARLSLPSGRTRPGRPSTAPRRSLPSPTQEALVHRAGTAEALFGQGFPLAACAKHVHHGLEDLPRRLWRPTCSRLARIRRLRNRNPGRNQRLHPRPEVVRHYPRFNSFRCHPSAPTPRMVRLGPIVSYLRISSKVISVDRIDPPRLPFSKSADYSCLIKRGSHHL